LVGGSIDQSVFKDKQVGVGEAALTLEENSVVYGTYLLFYYSNSKEKCYFL